MVATRADARAAGTAPPCFPSAAAPVRRKRARGARRAAAPLLIADPPPPLCLTTPPPSPPPSPSPLPQPTAPATVGAADTLALAHEPATPAGVRGAEAAAIADALCGEEVASVYVCGTPGAGKSVTVARVVRELVDGGRVARGVLVNCTGLRKAVDFYRQVAEMLGCVGRSRRDVVGFATAEGPRVALVLDEVDYLSQKLLYDVFELPTLPATRLAVVGIANRLDLPLKVLPLLQATNRAPRVVTFRPYTAAELTAIVHARLADAGVDADLHAVAISLAAKKVASMSGDARRMLDVCREAMLALEAGDDVSAIGAVSQILARGGRSSAAADTVRTLPVQHQLALCCVANEEKRMAAAAATVRGGSAAALAGRAATVGGLYESFKSTCAKTSIPCIGLSDFADLLESLAGTHGLLDISAKGKRKRKRTAFGPAAGELRGKFVRLDSVSIADIQTGCRETPLLRLLVGTEG